MNEHNALPAKWLCNLVYIHIAGLAVSVVAAISGLGDITAWLGRIVQVGMIWCLFQLQPVNPRYRKAAILLAVTQLCGLAGTLISMGGTVLSFAASICAIIANYQEYNGHSELTDGLDPKLSRQWNSLFLWSIGVGMLGGFASMVTVAIGALAGMDSEMLVSVAVAAILVVEVAFEAVYLRCLNRTLRLLDQKTDIVEENNG